MTIKSSKQYDQHAHDQPTQATPWAAQYGGDTRRTERSLRGMFGDSTYEQVAGGGRGPGSDTTIDRRPAGGGALRPERLTGPEMDAISPGWTDRAYERAQRPDGGNG